MVVGRGEDRPLLVSFLDGAFRSKGSDEEDYSEGKWRGMGGRGRNRGRGRSRGLVLGATSVMNRWPDHLTMCWLLALTSCLFLIICIFLLSGAAKRAGESVGWGAASPSGLLNRCQARHDKNDQDKAGLSKTNLYLHVILNNEESFDPAKYKAALTYAVRSHPNHNLNIFVLLNDTLDLQDYKRNSRFQDWELYHRGIERHKFFDTSSGDLEDSKGIAASKDKYVGYLSEYEDRINIIRSTFSNYFKHSPVKDSWMSLSRDLIPVVFRVLTVWEHGGITMPWKMFLDRSPQYSDENSASGPLRDLVHNLKKNHSPIGNDGQAFKKRLIEDNLGGVTIESKWDFLDSDVKNLQIRSDESDIEIKHKETVKMIMPVLNYNKTYVENPQSVERVQNMDAVRNLLKELDSDSYMDMGLTSSDYSYYSDETEESERSSSSDVDDNTSSISSFSVRAPPPPAVPKIPGPQLREEIRGDLVFRPPVSEEHVQNTIKKLVKAKGFKTQKDSSSSMQKDKNKSDFKLKKIEMIKSALKLKKKPLKSLSKNKKNNASKKGLKKRVKRNVDFSHFSMSSFSSLDDSYPMDFSDNLNAAFGFEMRNPYSELSESDLTSIEHYPKNKEMIDGGEMKENKLVRPELQDLHDDLFNLRSSSESDYSSSEEAPYIYNPLPKIPKFKEPTGYRHYKPFNYVNIFAMPNKMSLILDPYGYYLSSKKPCHAFLGQVIATLQSKGNKVKVEDLMPDSLKVFCKDRKFSDCPGIDLI